MQCKRSSDEFVITRLSFGDIPSDAIATLPLRKTALMSFKENLDTVKTIIRNFYDILDSFSTLAKAKSTTTAIEHILRKGMFKMKSWIFLTELEGHKFIIRTQGINHEARCSEIYN